MGTRDNDNMEIFKKQGICKAWIGGIYINITTHTNGCAGYKYDTI